MDGSGEIAAFRAAQYMCMSTEHQQYSTHNQSNKIRKYTAKRGIEIIKTYADDCKSGLSIGGRAALQQLIANVESGTDGFNVVLVYDVSRWGSFQGADESAYYPGAFPKHDADDNDAHYLLPFSDAFEVPPKPSEGVSYRVQGTSHAKFASRFIVRCDEKFLKVRISPLFVRAAFAIAQN